MNFVPEVPETPFGVLAAADLDFGAVGLVEPAAGLPFDSDFGATIALEGVADFVAGVFAAAFFAVAFFALTFFAVEFFVFFAGLDVGVVLLVVRGSGMAS